MALKRKITQEQIAAAFAWLTEDATTSETAEAFGYNHVSGSSPYLRLARSLREAYRRGLIEIKSSED